jgi:hypothetical protein
MLRQRACHLRFTAGDYGGALHEARAVHDEMCREAGEGSGEAVLFGLRRGILEAGAGRVGRGLAWVLVHRGGMSGARQLACIASGNWGVEGSGGHVS